MSDIPCKHCGRSECEHDHDYEPEWPSWCKCDPGTWFVDKEPPPACAKFVVGAGQYCATCEHEEACHAKEASS